jgi:hypothetical protein
MASGCTKPGTDIYVDGSLKDAFNFQKGTYWIYMDSLTGEADSFYVFNNITSTDIHGTHDPRETVRSEMISIDVRQKNTISISGDTINRFLSYVLHDNTIEIDHYDMNKTKGLTRLYQYIIVGYPFLRTNSVTVFPSYSAMGKTFTNVAQINSNATGKYDDDFYVASGVGILKMSMHHKRDTTSGIDSSFRVLELQRYSINK